VVFLQLFFEISRYVVSVYLALLYLSFGALGECAVNSQSRDL
ncbi:uncharacterized protein METZ01_LOCUS382714, partial [marine metagenome]